MKTLRFTFALLLLGFAGMVFAGEETLKGEILDLSCYMSQGAHGKEHQKCAQSCINRGIPMGLLTEKGEVYLLLENHKQAEAYATAKSNAAETVEIKGTVSEKGGIKSITVNACSKI